MCAQWFAPHISNGASWQVRAMFPADPELLIAEIPAGVFWRFRSNSKAFTFNPMNIEVLSAGRENEALDLRNRFLNGSGYRVTAANSVAKAINSMFEGSFDVILLCNSFTAEERRMLMGLAARYCPSIPVVLISDAFDRNHQEQAYVSSGNIMEIMGVVGRAVVEKAPARRTLQKAS